MRKEIEAKMDVRATDIYGLTEIIGPGVSSECEAQYGLHVFDDHFLPLTRRLNPSRRMG